VPRSPGASLPFREAVLSGCSTGWRPSQVVGVELSGDDMLGLAAAFLEAGVRSILVSVPPAADLATYELMVGYHRRAPCRRAPGHRVPA